MSDKLIEFLKASAEEAARAQESWPKPIASVYVSNEGRAIEVCLDTSKNTSSEWIKGEGADIGLDREHDTGRVFGARLPLYAKTLIVGGNFPTLRIDLETGAITIEPEKDLELPEELT